MNALYDNDEHSISTNEPHDHWWVEATVTPDGRVIFTVGGTSETGDLSWARDVSREDAIALLQIIRFNRSANTHGTGS